MATKAREIVNKIKFISILGYTFCTYVLVMFSGTGKEGTVTDAVNTIIQSHVSVFTVIGILIIGTRLVVAIDKPTAADIARTKEERTGESHLDCWSV